MNMTHTPGPWQVEKGWNGGGFTISSRTSKTRDERGLIADTAHSAFREQEEANARLIAAAPELLAACLKVANDPYTTCACSEVVRAAITKATGGAS